MAALAAIGSVVSALGGIASGVASKNAADFEAEQMEMKGKEEIAASQREAIEQRNQARAVTSRQQALAAASGAGSGVDAPTILKLMSSTAGRGEYLAQGALYGGRERAAGLRDSAKGRRMTGRASLLGSVIGGFGQAASGIGNYMNPTGSYG